MNARYINLVKATNDKLLPPLIHSNDIILHQDIIDILFTHKNQIYKKLIDVRGIFLLDHVAIKIIDPKNTLLIFSMTPSVEYNLIAQNLWQKDQSFSVNFQKKHSFYQWESAYDISHFNEIKALKEFKHGFTFGFSVSKAINGFHLIYSFATRSEIDDPYNYYYDNRELISDIGDYCYNSLLYIYIHYYDSNLTELTRIIHKKIYHKNPHLKLIKDENNDESKNT